MDNERSKKNPYGRSQRGSKLKGLSLASLFTMAKKKPKKKPRRSPTPKSQTKTIHVRFPAADYKPPPRKKRKKKR